MSWKSMASLAGGAFLALSGCGVGEQEVSEGEPAPFTLSEELKLSGSHFNLNLIGVPRGKSADMTGSSGRRIFVNLTGKTTINLSEGPFAVLDANGTDGAAAFQLPNPDPDNSGTTQYSVFARALGKPGGSSTTTTCFTDSTGETYCSVYSMVLVRTKGKQSFTNVSQELLYVYADTDGDGRLERYPLFSDSLSDYFWNYDNSGLKLAQLRFYEVQTTVP
ncbi:MAG: hypothetical protein ACYC8T_20125 [Myxococcaceae bacterium]